MAKSKIFLLDGHAICYRAFYATMNNMLTNSKGQPTNAVFGFVNIFRKILKKYQPTHLAVCFDTSKKTIRQEKFKEYKIQRPSMPDELRSQIPIIRDIIKAYQVPIYECDGYEADDVLGALATQFQSKGDVVIVSDDKDMYQLINDDIKMYNSRKDAIIGAQEAEEKFGVKPEYISDWLGLAGDSSDNIPGVKGVGAVTATKLINEFGTVEQIIESADQIKSKSVQSKIKEFKDDAIASKELATLMLDVPIEIDFKDLTLDGPDQNRLVEIFKEMEFRTWLKDLGEASVDQEPEIAIEEVTWEDIETLWQEHRRGALLLDEDGWIVVYENKVATLNKEDAAQLKPYLENKSFKLVSYNFKEVSHQLAKSDVNPVCGYFDIQLAGYILFSGKAALTIESLAWQVLKQSQDEPTSVFKGVMLWQMFLPMCEMLGKEKLNDLYDDIEQPLSEVLFNMEHVGVNIDRDVLAKLSELCTKSIGELQAKIFKEAGEEFNINSPKQLGVILFDGLGLPVIKKTKTGYSTNEEVLTRLAPMHPMPKMVLEYRQLTKLKSTYIDALPELIDSNDHHIHARFNQAGAETGRLSSSQPNLQNIPIRTELGRKIRQAFVPSSDSHVLVSVDYSQIELRILAHLAKDEDLIGAFVKGEDIHNFTASQIFEIDENDVGREERTMAKRVNFGIVYGISAFGLAKDLEVTQREAQDFIDRYFLRYPKVKLFMDQEIEKAREQGYVETLFKRRRYIPDINNRNANMRHFAERQAINTPVQGTAADMIKLAMVNIFKRLEKEQLKSVMTITVHDEIVLDTLESEQDQIISLVKEEMEKVMQLSVPIVANVKFGPNWLDLKDIS